MPATSPKGLPRSAADVIEGQQRRAGDMQPIASCRRSESWSRPVLYWCRGDAIRMPSREALKRGASPAEPGDGRGRSVTRGDRPSTRPDASGQQWKRKTRAQTHRSVADCTGASTPSGNGAAFARRNGAATCARSPGDEGPGSGRSKTAGRCGRCPCPDPGPRRTRSRPTGND